MPTQVVIEGRVTRVLFRDETALFAAVKMRARGSEITAVGEFGNVAVGDEFELTGDWQQHPKWGRQLRVISAVPKLPRDTAGIVAYLSGGLFPGLGPTLARRLVAHFGRETLEILLSSPERAGEVRGIGSKRRRSVVAALTEHWRIQELALLLQGHGVSIGLTKKIHQRYGDEAVAVIQADPYRLTEDVSGIGFLKADEIARRLGLAAEAPGRIRAAILYVLTSRCETRGHTYLPERELVRECLEFLNREPAAEVGSDRILAAVEELLSAGHLVRDCANALYLREAHEAEVGLASRIDHLLGAVLPEIGAERLERLLAATAATAGLDYGAEQREAIRTAIRSPLAIVTGGPGTGKSTVIRGVVAALLALKRDAEILLAAPTGRAAKRMAEVTGRPAQTIHRLLEFSPAKGSFERHESNPLSANLLVVDEASMMDLDLARSLFRAAPRRMRVLLVGDADQLPSVGFGNVFADLIHSGRAPVVRLQRIFRQARESLIVVNAHRVNRGEMPVLRAGSGGSDFEFVRVDDEREVAQWIRRAAVAHRSAGRGLDGFNVLAPMRKGHAGVLALNALLQETLNPPSSGKQQIEAAGSVLRVGDKVMQIRNNYGKGVFNGDLGIIAEIASDGKGSAAEKGVPRLDVDFPDGRVSYSGTELDQLTLAYAMTIHKAQGSEYPGVVIVPLVREHTVMWQRNLLYTAITRARERVVLVGQMAALRGAVATVGSRLRYSGLAGRLKERGCP